MNNNKTCKYCGKSINDYFKVCPYCSKKIDDRICKSCGKSIKNEFEICPYCGDKEIEWEMSDKNGFICLLSAIFLFPFAIHRFYTGKKLTAIILIILNIIFFIFSYIALPWNPFFIEFETYNKNAWLSILHRRLWINCGYSILFSNDMAVGRYYYDSCRKI